jgi:hypothetical protein
MSHYLRDRQNIDMYFMPVYELKIILFLPGFKE